MDYKLIKMVARVAPTDLNSAAHTDNMNLAGIIQRSLQAVPAEAQINIMVLRSVNIVQRNKKSLVGLVQRIDLTLAEMHKTIER